MKILVTGADGFVGRWTCADLLAAGHQVLGGVRGAPGLGPAWSARLGAVQWVPFVLADRTSVERALALAPDAVLHLAAIASGAQARANPVEAWAVNALGTAELVYALERTGSSARLVFASTGEVYGRVADEHPIGESVPVQPCSPYAASKVAAEAAVLESHRRRGADVIVARAFAQTGPGQSPDFVVPALARRVLEAARTDAREIQVGNLEPVREFIDVRDMAAALRLLLERGEAGAIYNVAAGRGVRLRDVLDSVAALVGWRGTPKPDPALFRSADIPYLVGDGSRIAALGWRPAYDLDRTLADLLDELRDASAAASGAVASPTLRHA